LVIGKQQTTNNKQLRRSTCSTPSKPLAQRSNRNAVNNLSHKRFNQQVAGVGFVESTALQIEDFLGIQLTDGCTVGTFHVVSRDFQLGFGINAGFGR
jgi:hypothetical protein